MFLDISRCSYMFLDVSSPRWFGIHNISQISLHQPNITISAKYHYISQISQFQPDFQISQCQPNITISAKYHNFSQISQFQPNFIISDKKHLFKLLAQVVPPGHPFLLLLTIKPPWKWTFLKIKMFLNVSKMQNKPYFLALLWEQWSRYSSVLRYIDPSIPQIGLSVLNCSIWNSNGPRWYRMVFRCS